VGGAANQGQVLALIHFSVLRNALVAAVAREHIRQQTLRFDGCWLAKL